MICSDCQEDKDDLAAKAEEAKLAAEKLAAEMIAKFFASQAGGDDSAVAKTELSPLEEDAIVEVEEELDDKARAEKKLREAQEKVALPSHTLPKHFFSRGS